MPIRFTSPLWKPSVGLFAACAMLALPVYAQQEAPAPADGADALDLPANIALLGENPNLRRATAKINGQVITGTDVDQRLALVLAANENPNIPPEEVQRLRQQVLSNLIDETLQIQEAKAQEIQVGDDEIAQTYARVATQNFGQIGRASCRERV